MITAGLLGFGVAGRYFHAPLLAAAGIPVRAVVTRQRDLVASVIPDAQVLDTEADLFARGDVDIVVIATPNHLHVAQAREALLAGKHVVIDKPLCLHAHDAAPLAELATRQRRLLTVFHNRRWDGDFLTLKKLLDSGRLGTPNAFHARWDRYRPAVADRWREHAQEGNGVLYDLGAHLIDQTLQLFGMPQWIQADLFTQRADAIATDGFELLLGKDSLRISLGVSMLAADGGPRYRVHGDRGSFVKSGLDVQEAQLRAGVHASDPAFGIEPQTQWGSFTNGANGERESIAAEPGRWRTFYARVREGIETGSPPPVTIDTAVDVIKVIEAAMRSSASGSRVSLR